MDYCAPHGIPHSAFLEWDDDDQAKALAWQRAQREICGSCGTRQADWEDDRDAFIVDSDRCPGCERLEQERDMIRDLSGGNTKGIRLALLPRHVVEARQAEKLREEAGR